MKNISNTFKEQPIVTAAIGIPILWLLFFCIPTIFYVSSVHRINFAFGGLAFCGFISFVGAGIGLHDPYRGNKNIRKVFLIVMLCLCCLTVGTLAIFLCTLRPSSFGSFGYIALRLVFGSIIATIAGASGFAA